jgi:sulfatase modifying factor 1
LIKSIIRYLFILIGLASCAGGGGVNDAPTSYAPGDVSTVTGTEYNSGDGFEVSEYLGQPEGPNLVYIEGGRAVLGSYEEDLLHDGNSLERTVTIASFYMDETEIANLHWLEYLYFLQKDSADEDRFEAALPDTLVWRSVLAYNDPYVDHYLRYPGFRFFPVVGVTWEQCQDFCIWRTDAVNQVLAEDAGVASGDSSGVAAGVESGLILPDYRLPTEAEWEYAAQALIDNKWLDENNTHQRLYPWDGHSLRNPYGKSMGMFLANFKRGRGDYAGIAGHLNDGAMITDYIYNYPPNDYGLYNMAGNVNEWVADVYRPLSFQVFDDFNPYRRDGTKDEESGYDTKGYQSLVNNKMRVFKGGSWKDVAYWLIPGTRRYMAQDSCNATVGFRCAMIRVDSNH